MAAGTRSPSTRALQAEHTRQLVLDTALRLFAERGYDATSLQMIADELGITKSAVAYHFGAKHNILKAALSSIAPRAEELLIELSQIRGRRRRTDAFATAVVDLLVEYRDIIVMSAGDPAMRRPHDDKLPEDFRLLHAVFGPDPTAEERVAFWGLFKLPLALADVADLTDDQLRAAMLPVAQRMLRIP
jgi:AcrR family transcriptional regulator